MKPLYKPPPEKITVIRSAPVRQTGWLSSAQGKKFIRSIPLDWAMAAARLPGKANIVGQTIWFIAGLQHTEHNLSIPSRVIREFGVSRRAWCDALKSLVRANLILVVRQPGAKARITLLLGSIAAFGPRMTPTRGVAAEGPALSGQGEPASRPGHPSARKSGPTDTADALDS